MPSAARVVACMLAITATACAGVRTAPRPDPSLLAVAGDYAFTGTMAGAANISGVLSVDSAGTVALTLDGRNGIGARSCAAQVPVLVAGRFTVGCGTVALRLDVDANRLAPRGALSLRVTETKYTTTAGFDCNYWQAPYNLNFEPTSCGPRNVAVTRTREMRGHVDLKRVD